MPAIRNSSGFLQLKEGNSYIEKKERYLLLLILSAGAALRFYALDYGLPEVQAVDSFKFVKEASRMVATESFEPHYFQYPGFYTNLLVTLYMVFDVDSFYWQYLLGRILAAFFGTGLILITYFSARRVCGYTGACIAALLTAFSPVCVTFSRMISTECIVAFFMTAGMWILAGDTVKNRVYIMTGFMLGLAAGTKYTGGYLLLPLFFAAIATAYRVKRKALFFRGTATAALAAGISFLITTPWAITFFKEYSKRFLIEIMIQRYGQMGAIQYGYFDYLISSTVTFGKPWLGTSLLYNMGPVVTVVGLLACFLGLTKRFGFPLFLYAVYVALYVFLISGPGRLKGFHFLIPILPIFFVMTGWFTETFVIRSIKGAKRLGTIFLFFLILIFPAYKSFRYVAMINFPITNHEAYAWMKNNIPPDSRVFLAPLYTANLSRLPLKTYVIPSIGMRHYRLPREFGMSPEREFIFHPNLFPEFRKQGITHVVLNSYYTNFFSDIPDNQRWFPKALAAYKAFMKELQAEARLLYKVDGYARNRLGPDIAIYRLND